MASRSPSREFAILSLLSVVAVSACGSDEGAASQEPAADASAGSAGDASSPDAPDASTIPDAHSQDASGDSITTTDAPVTNLCSAGAYQNPAEGEVGHVAVARWRFDRTYALSVTFDDSTPGQATRAMPLLISHGIPGTWFINPGVDSFQTHTTEWLSTAPTQGQELADHTMHHAGAATYAEAEEEIGQAAQIIWDAYPPTRSRLIAFNRGGSTTWGISEEQIQELLTKYHCVERVHSSGIAAGTDGPGIVEQVQALYPNVADGWGVMHFHGVCDPSDTTYCVCNTPGSPATCQEHSEVVNGGVSLVAFEYFVNAITTDSFFVDNVWFAGFASAYKYQQVRNQAAVSLAQATDTQLTVCLKSPPDPALFDEPVSLKVQVPSSWAGCVAQQGAVVRPCELTSGVAMVDAVVDAGDVVISRP